MLMDQINKMTKGTGLESLVRIDQRRSRVEGVLDHATANLLAAYPDGLLLPVPDVSSLDAQLLQLPLATEVRSLAFKSRLAVSSHIAAVLGQRSCGLFAIRFQTVQKVVDFIQRNPK